MSWSFVGLVAGTVSEAGTRLPHKPFVGAVVAGSTTVFLLGGMPIVRARSMFFRRSASGAATGPALVTLQVYRGDGHVTCDRDQDQ